MLTNHHKKRRTDDAKHARAPTMNKSPVVFMHHSKPQGSIIGRCSRGYDDDRMIIGFFFSSVLNKRHCFRTPKFHPGQIQLKSPVVSHQ